MNKRRIQYLVLSVSIGVTIGIGLYAFVYAKGASYLTNNPASCANCHIMNSQYDGWLKSSHRSVAACNDCHTPHNLIGKYTTKALNGFWHSFYFTSGSFHEPIRIGARNLTITENACQRCHSELTQAILGGGSGSHGGNQGEAISCVRCHRSVGHMH
jgi:cytochrome c nitrite reductase small subunit